MKYWKVDDGFDAVCELSVSLCAVYRLEGNNLGIGQSEADHGGLPTCLRQREII